MFGSLHLLTGISLGDLIALASLIASMIILVRQKVTAARATEEARLAAVKATEAATIAHLVDERLRAAGVELEENTKATKAALVASEYNAKQLRPRNGKTTATTLEDLHDKVVGISGALERHFEAADEARKILNLPPERHK